MKLAFASDFDNTLYFKNGCGFYSEDLKVIKEKQSQGLLFGVCTGRSLSGVEIPSTGLIDFDFYILATGSLILNKKKEIIASYHIPFDIVLAIAKEFYGRYGLAFNDGYDFYSQSDKYEIMKSISSLEDLPKEIHGISFLCENRHVAEEICSLLNKKYPIQAFHNGAFVDITAKGCSKGNAIRYFKEHEKIDRIGGMGDSFNDQSMLEAVDVSFTLPCSPKDLCDIVTKIRPCVSLALEDFLA